MRKLSVLFLFAVLAGAQTYNTIIITPKSDDTATGEIRLREKRIHGANHVGFKAPDPIAADVIWTLPAADGSSGQTLVTNGAGVLSFSFGAGAANNSEVSHRADLSGGYAGYNFVLDIPGLSVTLNRLGKWLITATLNVHLENDIQAFLYVNGVGQIGSIFFQQHIYNPPTPIPSEAHPWIMDTTLERTWIYNNTIGTSVIAKIGAESVVPFTTHVDGDSYIIAVWIGP